MWFAPYWRKIHYKIARLHLYKLKHFNAKFICTSLYTYHKVSTSYLMPSIMDFTNTIFSFLLQIGILVVCESHFLIITKFHINPSNLLCCIAAIIYVNRFNYHKFSQLSTMVASKATRLFTRYNITSKIDVVTQVLVTTCSYHLITDLFSSPEDQTEAMKWKIMTFWGHSRQTYNKSSPIYLETWISETIVSVNANDPTRSI